MRQAFVIPGRLAGMNEINDSNRTNRYTGAKLKRSEQARVCAAIRQARLEPYSKPVSGAILIVRNNRRSDRDNLEAGAKKVILDALKETGIIKNDGWKLALEFPAKCVYGTNERVVVMVTDEERTIEYIPYWTQLDSDEWDY